MGAYWLYVAIDVTKKTGKKTSHVVNFIVSMALKPAPDPSPKINYRPDHAGYHHQFG